MAKKKKRRGAPAPSSPPASEGMPTGVVAFLSFLVGAILMYVGSPKVPANDPHAGHNHPPGQHPSPTKATEKSGAAGDLNYAEQRFYETQKMQTKIILEELRRNPGRIPAEGKDLLRVFPHPDKKIWFTLFGQAEADSAPSWVGALVHQDPGRLGDLSDGLRLESHFALPPAEEIEKGKFNGTGSVFVLLTRKYERGQPPGQLIRIVPGEDQAQIVDEDVFDFALSPDGDAILYQKAIASDDLLGPRELKVYHGSQAEGASLRKLSYPKEQISEIGPWDPSGVFVSLTILTFEGGFEPTKTERFTVDAFNPTKLIPVETSSAETTPASEEATPPPSEEAPPTEEAPPEE